MEISQDQKNFYQSARERCRKDIEDMNNIIRSEWKRLTEEIRRVQEMVQTLEMRKQSVGQIYASASEMLGLENDLDISPAIQEEEPVSEELSIEEVDINEADVAH